MKKSLLMSLCIMLCACIAIGSTMAYLSDEDYKVNVMTLGNVDIEQHEKDRDGKDYQDSGLYPAVYENDAPTMTDGLYDVANGTVPNGVKDKIVTVENTGKSDAYVRTIFAFEKDDYNMIVLNKNTDDDAWTWVNTGIEVTLDTGVYTIVVAYLKEALPADETTVPSLKQVYMKKEADNEHMDAFGDSYEIHVLTQAVQTAGFENAEAALNAAFGEIEAVNCSKWFGGKAIALTAEDLQAALKSAKAGETILLGADITANVVMPSTKDLTIDGNGHKLNGVINLNGSEGATIKNIVFDAAHAQMSADGRGTNKQYALIMSGDATNKPNIGAMDLTIEGCTFTGTFANSGASIAFVDQARGSGASGDITIKNCTFATKNAYYDIYAHYTGNGLNGHGDFAIEGNTFKSEFADGGPIYLGRYASSTPVVVKGNRFETVTSQDDAMHVQAHSEAYTVSFDAADNTFGTNP